MWIRQIKPMSLDLGLNSWKIRQIIGLLILALQSLRPTQASRIRPNIA